jgi:hypothetical protein
VYASGGFAAAASLERSVPARCIGYLTKYLTKQLGDCHHPATDAQSDHVDRLAEALRYEPCSPTCANWLRYGIQPKNPRPGLVPGACKGKAHRCEHLGYAGRRYRCGPPAHRIGRHLRYGPDEVVAWLREQS